MTTVFTACTNLLAALLATTVFCTTAAADEAPCPLPGQTPALLVQMYFGQSIKNRGPVTRQEWDDFLRRAVTPRFPDGFTVYDAYGQWQDRETHHIARERSKVIEVATENTEAVRDGIIAISNAYRTRFHQQAVAIFSHTACVAFT